MRVLIYLCLFVGLLFPAAAGAQLRSADHSPNVIIVIADDVALSDIKALTALERTNPHRLNTIAWLMNRGLSFDNFYSMPVCDQTRFGIIYGLWRGIKTGTTCGSPGPFLPPVNQLTLPKILKQNGYKTAAFGKWHLGPHPDSSQPWWFAPEARGFSNWRAWNASNIGGHCGSRNYFDWSRVDDGVTQQTTDYHTTAIADAFVDWWSEADGPRFAYVAFQAPHQPLHVPPNLPANYPSPQTNRQKFEAMLKGLDLALATMIRKVKRSGDLDNTYIFFLGDNGTPPAAVGEDQNRRRVKKTTYEDGINVPFIALGPGIYAGSHTQALGHVVDLLATVADLTNSKWESHSSLDSVSLERTLRNGQADPRKFLISDIDLRGQFGEDFWDRAIVARFGDTLWKFRRYNNYLQLNNIKWELFDLTTDPYEVQPLVPDTAGYPQAVSDVMNRILDKYEVRPIAGVP